MEFLNRGFLGTRGDFLSDLLICALALIVPLLLIAIQQGRLKKIKVHHFLMLAIYYTVVAYVIVYEANMLSRGGVEFLNANVKMDKSIYWVFTGFHVLLGAITLIAGALTIRLGNRARADVINSVVRKSHRRNGWVTFILLVFTSLTGVGVYYFTFVYG